MKEVRCDGCGSMIRRYDPNSELLSCACYAHEVVLPGAKKENVDYKLIVDFRHRQMPIEFHFCSLACLATHIEHMRTVMGESGSPASYR